MKNRRFEEEADLKDAIKSFYKIDGIDIQESEIKINPEINSITDVFYKDKRFQIKNVPGEDKGIFSLMEKDKLETVLSGFTGFEDFKEKFTKKPLRRRVSGKGIVLLLWANSPFIPPLSQERIAEITYKDNELINLCQKSEYDEIYLLDSNRKIKIWNF